MTTTATQTPTATPAGTQPSAATTATGATPQPAPAGAKQEAPQASTERKPIAKEFSALVEREKRLTREREAVKAERAAIEREKAEIAAERTRYVKPKNAREALERFGYTYKDATDLELNDGQPTPEQIARQAVERTESLEKKLEEEKKDAEAKTLEKQKADIEQAFTEFRTDIKAYCDEHAEDCELINIYGAQEAVFQLVHQHFTASGKLLSLKEATELVERECQQHAERVRSARKLAQPGKRELDPKEASATSTPEKPGQVSAQRRTLSSDLTSSTPTLAASPRVEEDRIARALAKLG